MTIVVDVPTTFSGGTYGTIKQYVQDYAARNDLSAYADFFMEAAQQRINRKLRIRPMEKFILATLDADNRVAVPSDFLQVKNFFLFNYTESLPSLSDSTIDPLETAKISDLAPLYVDSEQNVYGRWASDRASLPTRWGRIPSKRYSLIRQGAEWITRPVNTDLPYLGGFYYARLPILSASSDTNWLTAYAPDLLLRGGVLECEIFAKNLEMVNYWEGKFNETLQEVGTEHGVSEYAGSTLAPATGGP